MLEPVCLKSVLCQLEAAAPPLGEAALRKPFPALGAAERRLPDAGVPVLKVGVRLDG